MCEKMYTADAAKGKITEDMTPKFNFQQYKYILSAPISRTTFNPDLFLVYGNSAQVMRLLSAYLYETGGFVHSKFSGRLDCADICIETIQKNEAQVILPCYGDRVFGQTQDHEMAFTFPADKVSQLLKGLEGTHLGGIRYPIPSYLNYTPTFPKHYYDIDREWETTQDSTKQK
jgi:uncharacterized protein (DUF169 family)